MVDSPRVSIIVPLFNDEEYVANALESCLAQSLREIEIVCVDDASTDNTVRIVEQIQQRDSRVRLIRHAANSSAFQARRTAIKAARAPYALFLDGDDELSPRAAQIALRKATASGADVVGFGVSIISSDSRTPARFEAALQPKNDLLEAAQIIPALFPVSEEANGHLWRYLFATELLQRAYSSITDDQYFYRANDLPITFLALAQAKRYVSTTARLYRYNFRRGTSGHAIDTLERFEFLLSGLDPISSISGEVRRLSESSAAPQLLRDSYESARLHIVASLVRSCVRETSGQLLRSCLSLLQERVGRLEIVRATSIFCPEALDAISTSMFDQPSEAPRVRSVLLHTAHLDTGGLQSVLLDQARALASAGFRVTIAVLRTTTRQFDLPAGVNVELLTGSSAARVDRWLEICVDNAVDVIIDHHILYNENWVWRALAALSVGIPTIGWVHNFALRPVFDATRRTSFLVRHLPFLWRVVTLSPTDVAFWKMLGVERTVYLPNPLSPLALTAVQEQEERRAPRGRVELIWWGRLDGPTKQVLDLVTTARELKARGVDFRLRIVGPDSGNLTAAEVERFARARGVAEAVDVLGEHDADELPALLKGAHLLISTSAIEGAPLTLMEAQAFSLPIVMYDLPWLVASQNNGGMIRTAPSDPASLADAIAELVKDPERYRRLASNALQFARDAASIDVDQLLIALLRDALPATYSPEPTLAESRELLQLFVRFAEHNFDGRSDASRGSADVRRQLELARRELAHITAGPSFRIGRTITYLPRKIATGLRRSRDKS